MRKLILITIAICQLYSFGQNSPCVNDVSTNPQNPNNLNLPLDTTSNIAFDSLFLNHFNWVPFGSQGNLMDLETTGLSGLGSDQKMRHLYNNNGAFYDYINNELKMPSATDPGVTPNHQEGWELIGVNLGIFPDNTPYTDVPDITNQHPRMPYVILYHRYLSKIRVFVNVHDQWALTTAYQAARIRLTLNTGDGRELNGLFRLQEGLDRTLDQPTNVRSAGVIAGVNNDKQRWIIGDFTVAFDPCVCDYPSAFNVDVELVKNWDFELYGRSISTEEEIIDENGSFINNNFLSGVSVDYANPEVNEGGFVMYKKMEDLFDDYIIRMEHYDSTLAAVNKHNARIDRNLAIAKWVKYAIDFGVSAATGGSSTAVSLVGNVLQHAPDLFGADTTSSGLANNWDKAFKEAEKIIGTEVMTFVNDNFKKQDPPAVPDKPTANFSEMYFEGRLTQVDPKSGPMIYTPGTYGNSINTYLPDQHHYPVYNEALGVFALLEKPKIRVSETTTFQSCTDIIDTVGYFEVINSSGQLQSHETYENINDVFQNPSLFVGETYFIPRRKVLNAHEQQFTLEEPLKYYFNPALDIKDYSIDVSIVNRGEVAEGSSSFNNPYSSINFDFNEHVVIENDPYYTVNIESLTFDVDEKQELNINDSIEYNSIFLPKDNVLSHQYQFGYEKSFIYPNIKSLLPKNKTEYIDYLASKLNVEDLNGCMYYASKFFSNNAPSYQYDEIYLKVIINIKFEGEKSDGSPHEYTYMFTYKIDENDIIDGEDVQKNPYLSGSSADLTQFEENLVLDGEDFDGSTVDGCVLNTNNNSYICKAWNDVYLSGEFTVDSGYEVTIEAGNEVNVLPESVTPPEMVWQIVPVLDFSNPMPPVDETYVTDFCNDNNAYQARMSSMPISNNNTTDTTNTNGKDNFAFNVFPNPTSGRTTASITLNEAATGSLFITDVNGRKLGASFEDRPISAGESRHQLPTETLASGIYLVHLFVDGEHHVKRVVKQ